MNLGVLGTMVWDRIEHPDGETVERWGGITYSLAAAAAAMPDGWTIRPIIKLGRDLAESGRVFLESVPGLRWDGSVVEVAEANNRVHLRYQDRHQREEQLTGGVPGWEWQELAPHLEGLDALYVNLISGFELDHHTAARLAARFTGPRYLDLHSLVLGVAAGGHRVPRRPARRERWFRAFHVVQMNEHELSCVAGQDDPRELAAAVVREGVRAVLITRGPDGADWLARSAGPVWPRDADGGAVVQSGTVALEEPWTTGDPTGCGDVWGATCFAHLLRGAWLKDAMEAGNRAAARNVNHRGAEGLYEHLRTTQ